MLQGAIDITHTLKNTHVHHKIEFKEAKMREQTNTQSNHKKAKENRWVFSLDLKLEMEGAILVSSGREFHSLGPATEKARSPLRLSRT